MKTALDIRAEAPVDKPNLDADSVATLIALDFLRRAFSHLAGCLSQVDAELARAALDDVAQDCAKRLAAFSDETVKGVAGREALQKAATVLREVIRTARLEMTDRSKPQ